MKELETVCRVSGKVLYLGSTLPAAVSMHHAKEVIKIFREACQTKQLTVEEAGIQIKPYLMQDTFILGYSMAVAYVGCKLMNWKSD